MAKKVRCRWDNAVALAGAGGPGWIKKKASQRSKNGILQSWSNLHNPVGGVPTPECPSFRFPW